MSADSKMVMTVRIDKKIADSFSKYMANMGLRRDTYLNQLFPAEIDRLNKIPPNSARAAKYLRLNWQLSDNDKARLGFKLDSPLVHRINETCLEKGVPRDQFIEKFLDLLVNGYIDSVDEFGDFYSPLAKAYELLTNPYWEANGELNIYEDLYFEDSLLDRGIFKRMFEDVLQKETPTQAGDVKEGEQ